MRPYYDYEGPMQRGESPFTHGVKVLMIANVAVFVLQAFLARVPAFRLAMILTTDGIRSWQLWRLVTYGFLHGGAWHLLFNMLGLFLFGGEIERRFGTRRFVAVYLGAIVFGGVVFSVITALVDMPASVLGASGGVVALLVIFAFCWPKRQILLFLVMPVPAWLAAGVYLLVDVGYAVNMSMGSVVHIAGAVYGVVWLKLLPSVSVLGAWSARRRKRARKRDDARMERILGKVHEEGLHALSRGEKRFLTRMGRQLDNEQRMGGYRRTRRLEWTEPSDD